MNTMPAAVHGVPMTADAPFITSPFDGPLANSLVRVIESAIEVHRRYQFFVWSRGSLQALLPHELAICGAWNRTRKQLRLEAFNAIQVPAAILGTLTDSQSELMQHVVGAWVGHGGKALALDLATLAGPSVDADRDELLDAGFVELLVHAVSRPQRASELETLFVFASLGKRSSERHRLYLESVVPHLHSTYLRVQAVERQINDQPSPTRVREVLTRSTITEREKQILGWVREGMSNHQIGTELQISPLTVKNHVQKILRKLGAANRAQAVAKAMSLNLLGRSLSEG